MPGIGLAVVVAGFPRSGRTWSETRVASGQVLRLRAGTILPDRPYLPLAGNWTNQTGISPEALEAAAVGALASWRLASGGAFDFDWWMGDDPSVYDPDQDYDGLSSLYFASAAGVGPGHGAAAFTRIWYDEAGDILEVDIVLNDMDFRFTTDPAEADAWAGGKTLLLEDVVTHELGHALGLGHSGLPEATLFPWAWPDQCHLHCDDLAGIRALYDQAGGGRVTGRVTDPAGTPVFGAHVVAISETEGQATAAVFTDAEGSFTLPGLAPGGWHLMAEPFRGPAAALSEYYEGIDGTRCPGGTFSRTFLQGTRPGELAVVTVEAGRATALPPLTLACGDGAAAVPDPDGGAGPEDAPALALDAGGRFARVLQLPSRGAAWYALEDVEGELAIKIIGASLSSPAAPVPALRDAAGQPVDAVVDVPWVVDPESGFASWDGRLVARLPARGDYFLVLEPGTIPTWAHPKGDLFLDQAPFVALLGHVGPDAWGDWDPADAGCPLEGTPAAYESPGGAPLRRSLDDPGSRSCGCAGAGGAPQGLLALLPGVLLAGWRRRRDRPARHLQTIA